MSVMYPRLLSEPDKSFAVSYVLRNRQELINTCRGYKVVCPTLCFPKCTPLTPRPHFSIAILFVAFV